MMLHVLHGMQQQGGQFSISVRLRQRRGSNPLETRSMFEYMAAQHLLQSQCDSARSFAHISAQAN
jgi:hypothetical protein